MPPGYDILVFAANGILNFIDSELEKFELILISNGSDSFICKAFRDEAVVCYRESLITQQMDESGSP